MAAVRVNGFVAPRNFNSSLKSQNKLNENNINSVNGKMNQLSNGYTKITHQSNGITVSLYFIQLLIASYRLNI